MRRLWAAAVAVLLAFSAEATVSGTSSRTEYTGNGSTTVFSFSFRADDSTWVKVYLSGALQGSGYTVTRNANQSAAPGGSVTFTTAPSSGVIVRLQRETPKTQGTQLSAYSAFPSKTVESTFDKLVLQGQEIDRRVSDAESTHASDKVNQEAALVAAQATQAARDLSQDSALSQARVDFAAGAGGFGDSSNILASGGSTSRTLAAHLANDIRVQNHGATCDGAANDTSAYQGALNRANVLGGGKVIGCPKATSINSVLTIYSNTTLEHPKGAVITFAAGSTGRMLQNSALTAQRSVADAAITATATTLTSATAAFSSADVGRSVVVTGAGGAGSPLTAKITVYTNSTTVTLDTAAKTTVSGAAASIYNRDSKIAVVGGTWARGNAGGIGAPGLNAHTLAFRHLDGLDVTDIKVTSTSGKFSVSVGDATDVRAQRLSFDTASDGFHVTGPASRLVIRDVSGTTGDDTVAFTALDYPDYQDVAGDISDVLVDGVAATATGSSLVKLSAAGLTKIRRMTLRNITGTAGDAIAVIDEPTSAPTSPASDVGDLVIDGVAATVTSNDVRLDAGAGQNAIVRNLTIQSAAHGNAIGAKVWGSIAVDGVTLMGTSTQNTALVATGAGTVIDSLTINGVKAVTGTAPLIGIGMFGTGGTVASLQVSNVQLTMNAAQLVTVYGSTTVSNLSISNVRLNGTGGADILNVAGTVTDLVVSDVQMTSGETTGSSVVTVAGTLTRYRLTNISTNQGRDVLDLQVGSTVGKGMVQNVHQVGTNRFANFNSSTEVTLSNVTIDSPINPVIYVGSGSTLTVRGSGIHRVTAWTGLQRASTEVVHIINPDFPVDLSALAKTDGDTAMNTNAGLACGVGRAISNGTNWKNIYSGATY